MPSDASDPERAPWHSSKRCVFFWGVLLLGCAEQSSGPARASAAAPSSLPTILASARAGSIQPARRVGVHIPSATGTEGLSYVIRIDRQLTRLDGEICPSGFAIQRLNAPSPGAQRLLIGGKISTPEADESCPDEGLDLPLLLPDECLRYAVDLTAKSEDPTSLERVGDDILASPDLWLWVPTPRPLGAKIRVHFELPEGLVAAMPWPEGAGTGTGTGTGVGTGLGRGVDFVLPETAFAWKSASAFGHRAGTELAVGAAKLRVFELGAGFGERQSALLHWIAEGARVSSLLFGRFPVQRPLVLVVPSDRSGPAFGMALRGGGPAVVMLVDRRAGAAKLADDWTCVHEFLHLGVPRLPLEDAWLFEGLATYYSEVTRARAGLTSAKRAYQHLLAGFQRGRQSGGARTLRDASAQMHEQHGFQHVYWAGAALAFLTDIDARRAGGRTLDAALRAFAECCAASEDEWTAQRVLAYLDQSMGAPRFESLAQRWLDRQEFPELDATLHALGVTSGARDEAIFARAPDAALRDAIMAPDALSR